MLIVTFVQPRDRLRFLSQTDIDGGDIVGCHIFLPRDHLELMQNAQGFVPVTCPRVRIPEPGHIERMTPRQPGRPSERKPALDTGALSRSSSPSPVSSGTGRWLGHCPARHTESNRQPRLWGARVGRPRERALSLPELDRRALVPPILLRTTREPSRSSGLARWPA